jgi:acetylornithine/N-succinyldiaminopimelate aminotransferase
MTCLMSTYPEPSVTFVKGSGTVLIDDHGQEYLDFLCGLAVTSLGHARPEVVDAIALQAATLSHVSNLYDTTVRHEVASILDDLFWAASGSHGRVFFANSGAEANECAFKLARKARPGRFVIISSLSSFHGRTMATLAATGQPEKHVAFQPLPAGFVHVPFGDLDAARVAIEAHEAAGVLVECIQAEGGINVPPPGYLPGLERAAHEAGALFMVDEVQSGLGRTGQWFSFEDEGLSPDVVTMAKSLGNGMPVGACWARSEVADAFQPGDHGSTFGGQPLAMAAARATLETMVALDAPRLANEASLQLVAGLLDIPGIEEVRGRGLLLGAKLTGPIAGHVANLALRRGLVVNAVRPDTIRITPPLTIKSREISEGLVRLKSALHDAMEEST